SAANSLASTRPKPLEPPVINTTFPFKSQYRDSCKIIFTKAQPTTNPDQPKAFTSFPATATSQSVFSFDCMNRELEALTGRNSPKQSSLPLPSAVCTVEGPLQFNFRVSLPARA